MWWRGSFYELWNIAKLKPLLFSTDLETLSLAFISSRLDYFNCWYTVLTLSVTLTFYKWSIMQQLYNKFAPTEENISRQSWLISIGYQFKIQSTLEWYFFFCMLAFGTVWHSFSFPFCSCLVIQVIFVILISSYLLIFICLCFDHLSMTLLSFFSCLIFFVLLML